MGKQLRGAVALMHFQVDDLKLLHHAARRFYAPVVVVAVPTSDGIALRVVNDQIDAAKVQIEAFAVSMDGATRKLGTTTLDAPPDQAINGVLVPSRGLHSNEILVFEWTVGDDQHSDHFAPHPYKSYDMANPGIEVETTQHADHAILTLTAQRLALFVSLDPDQPGRFSDNGFHLIPGQPVSVRFEPKTPVTTPNFTIRDLYSATHEPERAHT